MWILTSGTTDEALDAVMKGLLFAAQRSSSAGEFRENFEKYMSARGLGGFEVVARLRAAVDMTRGGVVRWFEGFVYPADLSYVVMFRATKSEVKIRRYSYKDSASARVAGESWVSLQIL